MTTQAATLNTGQPGLVQPQHEKWVLAGTILPSSMAFISATALTIALPAMQADLGISGSMLVWIINSYTLFLSALILLGGSLGDHYGRKRIFMIGIAIFTIASLLAGLASNALLMVALRSVQGIGGALMVPGSLAVLSAAFPPARRGAAIGTWSTFGAMTTVFGAPLGGLLAGAGLWRAVFFLVVPLGVLSLYILARYVPESRDEHAPPGLDYPGAALITLSLAGLTFGLTEVANRGYTDPLILGTVLGGTVGLGLFVWVEQRSTHPLVPLDLFKNKTFSGTNALTFFLYAALGVLMVFLPLNLVQVQEYPAQIAGFAMFPFGVILALMGRWAGGLVDRIGARLPLTAGPTMVGVAFVIFGLVGLTSGPSAYWYTFLPPVLLMSLGMGLTVAPLTATVMNAAPDDMTGTASGINNAVSRVSGVLAVALLGAAMLLIFNSSLLQRTAELPLSEEQRAALALEAANLAEAQPPAGLPADVAAQVAQAVQFAFLDGFRVAMFSMAALCWLGALLAFALIAPKRTLLADAPPAETVVVAQYGACTECTGTVHQAAPEPEVALAHP